MDKHQLQMMQDYTSLVHLNGVVTRLRLIERVTDRIQGCSKDLANNLDINETWK